MSELQIGLLILGLFIVTGVVAFNWWQERRFRRRAQFGVQRPEADLLLESGPRPGDAERIEPQFEAGIPADAGAASSDASGAAVAASIDYIAEIRAGEVIPASSISDLETALSKVGRQTKIYGYDYHTRRWEAVTDSDRWYTSLRISMQLVDREGPVTLNQLKAVADIIRENAQSLGAIAEQPDLTQTLHLVTELDEFCSDVDVIVGISVIARTGQRFQGAQIKALADANQMRLQTSGVFVCEGGDHKKLLFTLDNQDSQPFKADELRQLTTSGITFLLDVPRTPDGLKTFDRMVATSAKFAEALDGILADDNRVALNDAGLDTIRNQLRNIYTTMEKRGIPAGSAAAQRLFS